MIIMKIHFKSTAPYSAPSCTVYGFAAESLLNGSPTYTDGTPGEVIDAGEEYVL